MGRSYWMGMGALVAVMCAARAGWGQGSGNGPQGAPSPAAAGRETEKTMMFQFKDAPVDVVLNEISARFGFVIVKPDAALGRVSIDVPVPVNADQAIQLLNILLMSKGYAAVAMHWSVPADEERVVLRVVSLDEAKKSAPVVGMK